MLAEEAAAVRSDMGDQLDLVLKESAARSQRVSVSRAIRHGCYLLSRPYRLNFIVENSSSRVLMRMVRRQVA